LRNKAEKTERKKRTKKTLIRGRQERSDLTKRK